jgi:hypothetical protein
VVVVRAPAAELDLRCGGAPMPIEPDERSAADPQLSNGSLIGKRYVDEEHGIEVLCTKSGVGTLSIAGTPLRRKDAKPLPSSD